MSDRLPTSIAETKAAGLDATALILPSRPTPESKHLAFDFTAEQRIARAKAGDVQAQLDVALCYRLGLSVAADGELAKKWFQKAANKGNIFGKLGLADISSSTTDKVTLLLPLALLGFEHARVELEKVVLDNEDEPGKGKADFSLSLVFAAAALLIYEKESAQFFQDALAACSLPQGLRRRPSSQSRPPLLILLSFSRAVKLWLFPCVRLRRSANCQRSLLVCLHTRARHGVTNSFARIFLDRAVKPLSRHRSVRDSLCLFRDLVLFFSGHHCRFY